MPRCVPNGLESAPITQATGKIDRGDGQGEDGDAGERHAPQPQASGPDVVLVHADIVAPISVVAGPRRGA